VEDDSKTAVLRRVLPYAYMSNSFLGSILHTVQQEPVVLLPGMNQPEHNGENSFHLRRTQCVNVNNH
jgi:hypothetical protein